jgi:serine/threonine-protein kinase HipA
VADYTSLKAVTRLALTRWALLQYLIGNTDAHGKNVSFFSRPDGLAIAPFYDLVSVVQYSGVEHELAMAYGDEFRLEDVSGLAWANFAQRTGIPRTLLAREMRRMGKAALTATPAQAADAVYEGEEKAFVGRIGAFVQSQAHKLLDMATPTLAVDPSLL